MTNRPGQQVENLLTAIPYAEAGAQTWPIYCVEIIPVVTGKRYGAPVPSHRFNSGQPKTPGIASRQFLPRSREDEVSLATGSARKRFLEALLSEKKGGVELNYASSIAKLHKLLDSCDTDK